MEKLGLGIEIDQPPIKQEGLYTVVYHTITSLLYQFMPARAETY